MSILPASIGLSINDKECYYLSWIPSESGPLIINYGTTKIIDNQIPFDYLLANLREYNVVPQFTISLNNDYVQYDFLKSYNNSFIDNWNKNIFKDNQFSDSYDSYLYKNDNGIFVINILKEKKINIINQFKRIEYSLINLGVGVFSALEGVRTWYQINDLDSYILMKFSKKRMIELLLINNNNLSGYIIFKKEVSNFKLINYWGDNNYKNKLHDIIKSIFNGDFDLIPYKIFYYSIKGSREDLDIIIESGSNKVELINPFKNLAFDDNCKQKFNAVNISAYSELGNVFRGIDA